MIYTSGSTGRPKGAMLNHQGPVNTITEINRDCRITADDVLFGVSSLCFDLSVYDIFGALRAGATLVLPDPGPPDPAAWTRAVRDHHVTVWNSVPAVMQLFAEEAEASHLRFPHLRTVLLSGDWIPLSLPDKIRAIAPHARIIALGGATEASIWSIAHPIETIDPAWTSIPYGKPLPNQTWHILDDQGRDTPTWVTGELHIGGTGLALGYWGDPQRTDTAFRPHPRTGQRLYRTGDLGRYLPNGDIEFQGRADFQVKIQGFRVEPGEIEHTLLEHPGVEQAAVVARTTDNGTSRQLAAYITTHPTPHHHTPTPADLLAHLTRRLPTYMVPTHLVLLDELPLTPNGKLDRNALQHLTPTPTGDNTETSAGTRASTATRTATRAATGGGAREYTAPRDALETDLARIWESVLGQRPVGVHDDFFDLGGQSFTALRVLGQAAHRFGRRLALGALLEHRTVAELAQLLRQPQGPDQDWSPLVRLREEPGTNPWWFVHPAGGNVVCYRELAHHLPGSFHAFQAPGPAGGGQPLNQVRDLAALYLRALRQTRPQGPYRLGGWSSGAVIALEMTRLLEQDGETVEHLLVIDAPAPLRPRTVTPEQLQHWFTQDQPPTTTPQTQADLDATRAVFTGIVTACNTYHCPTRALNAPITLVRARDGAVSEFADHPHTTSPDWGWSHLTAGRTRTTHLTGTHHTLLTHPHVAALARAITQHTGEGVPQ